jgi:predicted nucleic acid-binding protein
MAYQIRELTRNTSVSSQTYFIDANVWIYYLQSVSQLKHHEKIYTTFLDDIITSSLDPQPMVLMPTILLSEIINTYLRKIAMKEFISLNGITSYLDFKNDYRPTSHFKTSYSQILDDILSYDDLFEPVNNGSLFQSTNFIKNNTSNLDFNDTAYYHYCIEYSKNSKITIVTNDSDFAVEDIPILTVNRDLLNL